MTVISATPATRKRGVALEDAIHDAVLAELAAVGYAAFTIEAVAVSPTPKRRPATCW